MGRVVVSNIFHMGISSENSVEEVGAPSLVFYGKHSLVRQWQRRSSPGGLDGPAVCVFVLDGWARVRVRNVHVAGQGGHPWFF